MKKYRFLVAALALTMVVTAGCGKKDKKGEPESSVAPIDLTVASAAEEVVDQTPTPGEVAPEGMYRSELTNEWIDEELKDQRPIAVMVDNEKTALPHYGLNDADVVYELMNSTMNGRITRFMVVMKDWKNIEQLGSVRSTRPTNVMLAAEDNAILIHDGGPFYINDYLAKKYNNNLSGGFARFSNGKSSEFTEYVTSDTYKNPTTGKTYDGLVDRVSKAGYSETYNDYYPGQHFEFYEGELDLSTLADSFDAKDVELPFTHNSSELHYNDTTKTYDYSEYGSEHVDPLDDNKVLSFKNVILQKCSFSQLDDHGYLIYNVLTEDADGYYLTDGKAIPITWSKLQENAVTVFCNAKTGEQIQLNTGKTYIALVPADSWDKVVIK